ncbi:glutamyl-tRNA synthetase [Xylona heveae TC161]|uniref:glutamate--tRNA ligase n=1 Tax=Xylona heveae (strain CBS 132557 / TC161) TaxID=1328760 RepID=A0A165ADP7_XYLHT|nr:glutamyl-tRNA synthetase [Xylona heveae TC161]KZF20307.1 glutamyl-tRNA synthetase [Xylona heveae TC161]
MATLTLAVRASHALLAPPLLVAHLINEKKTESLVTIKLEDVETIKTTHGEGVVELTAGSSTPVYGDSAVLKKLLADYPIPSQQQKAEEEWLERAVAFTNPTFKAFEAALGELDAHLTLRSFIVGYSLTPADLAAWGALRGNKAAFAFVRRNTLANVGRWFRYVDEIIPWAGKAVESLSASAKEKKSAKSREGASYDIALPDVEKGVITRFPPEPSGYLHIGHAKAALLNDYFAHEQYKGTLLLRFDDTNPSKEKQEYQDAIIEDLSLMAIYPNKTSYTSDYFDELYDYCVQMIKEGNAYADNTDQETMRYQRMHGIPSNCRDNSAEENLAHFEEMKKGSEEGLTWCIRAKISVDNPNKAMRDPVIYRCNPLPHHRTGSKWKIYPTYDFCCPIVDSIEGVTHALRTIEYRDRNPQYHWMLKALHLRDVHIWDFARMNFVRTLLSKRKLTKFVDDGVVWGWDDPRFPTIRGIRRRGMTIGALREFILKQGPSRNIVNLDWTLFWATNKKYIDPIAPRHVAVVKENAVPCTIVGARAAPYSEDKPKHAKNAEVGLRKIWYSGSILIDQEDAQSFKQDEEITLMQWGNAIVRKISHSINPLNKNVTGLELELHLQGDVKKTEKKVTWLSTEGQELVPVELVDFDYLITKDKLEEDDKVDDFLTPNTEFRTSAVADCNVADLKADDIIQFERKGYYRVDKPFQHGQPAVLFNIPTGKTK